MSESFGKGLSVIFCNVRSMSNKFDSIKERIITTRPDIVCISDVGLETQVSVSRPSRDLFWLVSVSVSSLKVSVSVSVSDIKVSGLGCQLTQDQSRPWKIKLQ